MKYLLLLLPLFLVGCSNEDKQLDKTVKTGTPIPPFSMQLADSTTWINTQDIPTGQAVAFIYFGTNCPYSRHQVQEIVDNIEDVKDVRFYLITPYSYKLMHQFYEHYKLNQFPNITTGRDTANFMGNYYNIPGVPYMAIYNRNKKLVKAYIGPIKTRIIKDALKS